MTHNSIEYLDIVRVESEPRADIEAVLEGHVFHVTKREYWPSILESGAILPNPDGKLATTFGSSRNSFFRKRGCVSVFDWRLAPPDTSPEPRYRCHPFQAAGVGEAGAAIAFLSVRTYSKLISWKLWEEQQAWGEMVAPYVEAGHPGPISIDLVERVLFLRLEEEPGSFAAMVRRSMDDPRE